MDRRKLYPATAAMDSSRRSVMSEATESDVGSLLSGLSQARRIPDRRRNAPDSSNGGGRRGPSRSNPTSNGAGGGGNRGPNRREKPSNDASKMKHNKHERYKREAKKIITIQAFARGYIQRFAYRSRLTMERTKKKFFAIQIQAHVRGFLQRLKFRKMRGQESSRPVPTVASKGARQQNNSKKNKINSKNPKAEIHPTAGLGSPMRSQQNNSRKPVRLGRNKPDGAVLLHGSDSERSEISIRMLIAHPRTTNPNAVDRLGESESDVGSIMSNLSVARKVPDRRRRQEKKELQAVKIQAIARGYIQRFLYRSTLAMQNTKKKYAAIEIQAYVRGHLQRCKGPKVSRTHVAPRKERLAPVQVQTEKKKSQALDIIKNDSSSSDSQKKAQKTRKPHKDADRRSKKEKAARITESNNDRNIRKPMRHLSGSGGLELPRELTIRKPRRHHTDSEESANLPVKQLTIRKPTRHESDSEDESALVPLRNLTIKKPTRHNGDSEEENDNLPPRRVTVRPKSQGRNGDRRKKDGDLFTAPRKVISRGTKQQHQHDSDMDRSERSLDPGRVNPNRGDRLTTLSRGGASTADSRFWESESDVGSLMSGLSQARKVPDRRQKLARKAPARGAREHPRNHGREDAKTKGAVKIQSIARGYIQRFAFKSRLAMEQTKKRFFAIQIQAAMRGFIVRSKLTKGDRRKVLKSE